jgi:hypothetical protein
LIWTLPNGKRAYNILHASYGTKPLFSTAWINTLDTAFKSALTTTGLLNNLDSATKYENTGVRDMAETNPGSGVGWSEWTSSNAAATGAAVAGQALPPGAAFVVTLRSGFSRQANRGRVYLPGFNTNALTTGGTIPDDVKEDCEDFIEGLKSALSNVSLTLCIAHPARQAYTGSTGVEYAARAAGHVTVENIVALNNVFDSQRLRSRL